MLGTNNKNKIILDLCGGTGSWSKPYKDAGYTVYNITLPEYDILFTGWDNKYIGFRGSNYGKFKVWIEKKDVYGILAAPPCTEFSFARTNAKTPRNLREGIRLVIKCLEIIWECQYCLDKDTQKYSPLKFWALENPYFGMLKWFLGEPAMIFDPYEFGDPYKKRTALWGRFNIPEKNPVKCDKPKFDKLKTKEIHPEFYGKLTRQERRAITPKGFAQAFFRANS